VRAGAGPALSVELVGIPGSGKSRRARTLAARLGDRGFAVGQPQAPLGPSVPTGPRLARKALACGATVATEPVTAARVVRGVLRSGQPGRGQALGRIVQWLVAEDVAARAARGPCAVNLVDEGLVQALWSIGLRADVGPVLAALDDAPGRAPADLLVVVRVPPEVALARLAARASRHSRTQLLDEPERLAELERGARLLEHLVEWWSRRWPDRVVTTLDGTDDDAADHERLLETVCTSAAAGRVSG